MATTATRLVICQRCHFELTVEGITRHLKYCGKPLARCPHLPAHTAAWRCSAYIRQDIAL